MFSKVLIANRGAISCRIQRTLNEMGVTPVILYSDADRESLHVLQAQERIHLPGNTPQETYLNAETIIAEALARGVEAVHPGYGFLSENSGFAQKCAEAGLVFLGPTPDQLETCGLKHLCRDIAREQGVPLLEGSPLLTSVEEALEVSRGIGYPVIIKSSAGGGGIGMQVAESDAEVAEKFEAVMRLSKSNFDDSSVFIEKYIERARHIEVQVFGDGKGGVLTLGERDCSAQRRNQKVVEESPAPGLSDEEREQLYSAAKKIAQSVNYQSAGTIEFLWDDLAREFYFLEVNARLQVEHGVTEEVWGIDLVKWMVELGAGAFPEISSLSLEPKGHAVQVRLYAEDPKKNFQPSIGLINHYKKPEEARCDTWVQSGTEISPFYDPMLAKVIVHKETRAEATAGLISALEEMELYGIEANLRFLRAILADDTFSAGEIHTRYLNDFSYADRRIEVLDAGLETTVQDMTGRLGRWDVGVPPSGAFDPKNFQIGNQILGNPENATGLEFSMKGAKLKFGHDTSICLTGADMGATLNGDPLENYQKVMVSAGDVLKMGFVTGEGARTYLLVEGGLDLPEYLGSTATFRLGKFGGHGGRTLQVGDVLHSLPVEKSGEPLTPEVLPELSENWQLRVTYGPHGAPTFFTDEDIEMLFDADWEVHYNSDRTGVRLIGPKPDWARSDGGEAGLHPSNIHDNAYTVGSVDFTGDMPIILGPDGPSLGGFVCPAVVIKADLWKLGQLKAGNKIRFICVTNEEAEAIHAGVPIPDGGSTIPTENPIISYSHFEDFPSTTYRQSGDGVILVEFGEMELDLDLRFRAQALYEALLASSLEGVLELVPGIRSLQVQYDTLKITQRDVVSHVQSLENSLPKVEDMEFQSRIVHLPLSWDDPSTKLAIEKYMQSVRNDAPWCPSNIEFIRRVNGLESIEEVKRIVYDASYFVMGLGDVYLGAPVATPLDPRHRLVTTKYNPARTWTAENSVGIGGAYLCIYGMEGPGGYQFVGRTLPIWNRYHQTEQFQKPWLLRFFDQIRWYEVSEDELLKMREDFLTGECSVKIEETTFKVKDYHTFLEENAVTINQFKSTQQGAFESERQEWERTGAMNFSAIEAEAPPKEEITLGEGEEGALATITGSLWKIMKQSGDPVKEGETLMIIESMKTEFAITAPCDGMVKEVYIEEGASVKAGQILASVG